MDLGEGYCYIASSATLTLPVGESQLEFVRGFEYRPKTVSVSVRAGEEAITTVNLERWIDMPAQNWYSGDGHIHMSLGGTIKMTPAEAKLMLEAEDVHLGNMVVSNASTSRERTTYSPPPHTSCGGERSTGTTISAT